jgi:hypothetical protein
MLLLLLIPLQARSGNCASQPSMFMRNIVVAGEGCREQANTRKRNRLGIENPESYETSTTRYQRNLSISQNNPTAALN